MKRLMALMALTTLTACDYAARNDLRNEREDRVYREAMDDYRAGRMDAAVKGFEKAVQNDPSNASARFQLACLHQDLKKDFLSAYCGYREYLFQHPESDRAKLAKDRLVVCEKELAKILAEKYGLNDVKTQETELAALRAELKTYKARITAAEKNLGISQERVRALSAEKDRLVASIKGEGDSVEDDSGESDLAAILNEKDLLDEDDSGESDLAAILKEKDLLDKEDETSTGSSLIPVRDTKVPVQSAKKPVANEKPSSKIPEHPKTYVVEDGDTLYGISKRFYGSIQYWKQIREANKALISPDNRLRAGDTLVLP